jgi:hypothetical protein
LVQKEEEEGRGGSHVLDGSKEKASDRQLVGREEENLNAVCVRYQVLTARVRRCWLLGCCVM